MTNLTEIHEIKALLDRHGFRFSKSLGQNFLRASWVPEKIADAAGLDEHTGVLEIGPGIGCLTAELSRRAKKVLSIEADRALQPVLAETLSGRENVELLFGDALKQDFAALARERFASCGRAVVCANLPYNISSPVLTALVRAGRFQRLTVMVQRELAQRVCAREDTADYGAFTVLMQWHALPEKLFDVPPDCFIPAPKVTSSVLRLERRAAPPAAVNDEGRMFALVRAAFGQRRKTLCNALANGMGLPRERIAEALKGLNLDERVRGEALSLADFAALSDALSENMTGPARTAGPAS
ncbi:MAG: ribosomal RNA small subunit methyltransferase A [Oscillospiraceae bacterium]|nr:ribosomal RNA small subunit methyltransferase A [Oscillospiraceae bacterium]